ncbi:MAG: hypothetical protein RL708_1627 [Bacteroidota bacterium]|jgi:hypothetical protein
MKYGVICCLFFLLTLNCAAQNNFKLFLVGDAGDDDLTGETLDSLKANINRSTNSALIFLGDNCYRNIPFQFRGFDSSRITQKRIIAQLSILKNYKGAAYFVPGNHDWWNTINFNKGKQHLQMEESFIEQNLALNKSISNSKNVFLPQHGSPGPSVVELNENKICVVFIDTDWLLLLDEKQTPKTNQQQAKIFYQQLDSVMNVAEKKHQQIVVVAHHPIKAYDNLLGRKVKHPKLFSRVKMSMMGYPSYQNMITQLQTVFEKHHRVVFASGHVHALQYYNTGNVQYLVSGSGSKTLRGNETKPPCNNKECRIWKEEGFFEIEYLPTESKIWLHHDAGKKKMEVSKNVN